MRAPFEQERRRRGRKSQRDERVINAIDINCDLGERPGPEGLEADLALAAFATSVNVACGFHAGDAVTIGRLVAAAGARGAGVGAHPSYNDRAGFGRVALSVPPGVVRAEVIYQVGALQALCRAAGVRLRHVKPHGALYNAAWRDPELARAVAAAVVRVEPALLLFAPPGSELERAGREAGLGVVPEFFADRGHRPDGTLLPRGTPGAVIDDPAEVAARAVRLVREGTVTACDGSALRLEARTICLHGDHPRALEALRAVRTALAAAGVALRPAMPSAMPS